MSEENNVAELSDGKLKLTIKRLEGKIAKLKEKANKANSELEYTMLEYNHYKWVEQKRLEVKKFNKKKPDR